MKFNLHVRLQGVFTYRKAILYLKFRFVLWIKRLVMSGNWFNLGKKRKFPPQKPFQGQHLFLPPFLWLFAISPWYNSRLANYPRNVHTRHKAWIIPGISTVDHTTIQQEKMEFFAQITLLFSLEFSDHTLILTWISDHTLIQMHLFF